MGYISSTYGKNNKYNLLLLIMYHLWNDGENKHSNNFLYFVAHEESKLGKTKANDSDIV